MSKRSEHASLFGNHDGTILVSRVKIIIYRSDVCKSIEHPRSTRTRKVPNSVRESDRIITQPVYMRIYVHGIGKKKREIVKTNDLCFRLENKTNRNDVQYTMRLYRGYVSDWQCGRPICTLYFRNGRRNLLQTTTTLETRPHERRTALQRLVGQPR